MAGLQTSTIISLLMLLHLHLKESLPSNTTSFTSSPSTHSTSILSNSSNDVDVGGVYGLYTRLLTILPSHENTRFEKEAFVIYAGVTTTIKFLTKALNSSLGHLDDTHQVTFTHHNSPYGSQCDDLRLSPIFDCSSSSSGGDDSSLLSVVSLEYSTEVYYICLRGSSSKGKTVFVHQGDTAFMKVVVLKSPARDSLLPLWLQISLIVALLCVSGLFSGLNLGLMSLDKTELNIMIASGTKKEKGYAKKILPLRKKGNFLLCTILLGNVLVNNCLTILLDDLTGSGLSAILASTFAIVLFGEIIPQAVCSRYGLAVGAHTIWFTKLFMLVTFPLSFPISLILDKVLGEEIAQVYNRDRLRELLKLTEKDMDLQRDEYNIITGALDLSKKTVKSIMTKIDDVFMIEYNTVLDFATVTAIMESGYTRVPIYEKDRSNIVALLNVKDLALVDPDNRVALKTVTQFYKHNLIFVFEDTKLDVILSDFKKGDSHMAMVQTVHNEGPGDPYYVVTGLVTLEDVIEEIIQAEIYDEFDTITDNIGREPRLLNKKDFSLFQTPASSNYPHLSPQLKLATFQYLTAYILPFKTPHVTERILHRLLNQNIVTLNKFNENIPFYLFQHSRPCDYFVFIAEGRVEVQCGKENLTYEAGPFSYFGTQALLVPSFRNPGGSFHEQHTTLQLPSQPTEPVWVLPSVPFVPDYSVRITSDVKYLKIRRDQYAVAFKASRHEAGKTGRTSINLALADDVFERDWVLNNQIYIADTREDRLRRQMKNHSTDKTSTQVAMAATTATQGKNSIFFNLRKTFARVPASPEESSLSKSYKRLSKDFARMSGTSISPLVRSTRRQRASSDADLKITNSSGLNQQQPAITAEDSLESNSRFFSVHPSINASVPVAADAVVVAISTTASDDHPISPAAAAVAASPPPHSGLPVISTPSTLNENQSSHQRRHNCFARKKNKSEGTGMNGGGDDNDDDEFAYVEDFNRSSGEMLGMEGGGRKRERVAGKPGGGDDDDHHDGDDDDDDKSSVGLLECPNVEFSVGGSEVTLDTRVVMSKDEKVKVVRL